MSDMNIYDKLQKIQTEIKAPKNLYNKFGNYAYRNAEGILEALKPYLAKYSCAVIIEDDIIQMGDRFYVKATVKFVDCDSQTTITNSALARESLDKKGMDSSQVTGATSSYARKYALNGMFLLDDTKDADTDEYHETTKGNVIDKSMLELIKSELKRTGTSESALVKKLGRPLVEMTIAEFKEYYEKFKSVPTEKEYIEKFKSVPSKEEA